MGRQCHRSTQLAILASRTVLLTVFPGKEWKPLINTQSCGEIGAERIFRSTGGSDGINYLDCGWADRGLARQAMKGGGYGVLTVHDRGKQSD
jgi:hypothetical protein